MHPLAALSAYFLSRHLRSAWKAEHILDKNNIDAARNYFKKVEIMNFSTLPRLRLSHFTTCQYLSPFDKVWKP